MQVHGVPNVEGYLCDSDCKECIAKAKKYNEMCLSTAEAENGEPLSAEEWEEVVSRAVLQYHADVVLANVARLCQNNTKTWKELPAHLKALRFNEDELHGDGAAANVAAVRRSSEWCILCGALGRFVEAVEAPLCEACSAVEASDTDGDEECSAAGAGTSTKHDL